MGREKRSAKRMGETGVEQQREKRGGMEKEREGDRHQPHPDFVVVVAPKLASSHDVKRDATSCVTVTRRRVFVLSASRYLVV